MNRVYTRRNLRRFGQATTLRWVFAKSAGSSDRPRTLRSAVAGAAFVFGGAWAWRLVRRDLFGGERTSVHKDASSVEVVSPPIVLVTVDGDSAQQDPQPLHLRCSKAEFDALRGAVAADIKAAEVQLVSGARDKLRSEMHLVFQPMHTRVGRFADWYFRYSTTYKLLLRALGAASRHARGHGDPNSKLAEYVQHEVEEYICTQFLKIVLWPEASDAACLAAFTCTVDASRAELRDLLEGIVRARMRPLCERPSEEVRLEAPAVKSELHLDWRAQSFKAQGVAAAYDKSPELSVAVLAAGAAAGKVAGAKAASALGSKSAISSLGSKFAAPFATKVAGLMAPSGATAGGLLGAAAGPFGTLAGVAVGLAADMMVNAGAEFVQRESFENDCHAALRAVELEWEYRLTGHLEPIIVEWCDSALKLVLNVPLQITPPSRSHSA